MNFKNKSHQAVCNSMAKQLDRRDNFQMAVLFLLTADGNLWNASKHHIRRGQIKLKDIKLRKGTPRAYTLLCCAKDMALGTNYLAIHDLTDSQTASPTPAEICYRLSTKIYNH